ncbi:TPA: aspartate-semialdehyde dehydrogenase [bacterium]|nr:aspartate-semialdehyde dehydrogenase [bacterium]
MKGYNVAVVGATGAVGTKMIETLEARKFPVAQLRALASERSKGKALRVRGDLLAVEELKADSFKGIEIALFSAGAKISRKFAPLAVKAGAIVVDNSSAFRMEKDVPLIVPEVNRYALKDHRGIIANPNCSTIQMVLVLGPLHQRAKIKRVVVTTYQSVSGTGLLAMVELREQSLATLEDREIKKKVYPYEIAFNLLPHIGEFLSNGYTQEEMKMINETRKILGDEGINVTATTVRVPIFIGHSEAVNIELEEELTPKEAREILGEAPGVIVMDDPDRNLYPYPRMAAGKDEVFVGRIRKDSTVPHGLDLFIVADNLRKGAALNAIQIAEELIKE